MRNEQSGSSEDPKSLERRRSKQLVKRVRLIRRRMASSRVRLLPVISRDGFYGRPDLEKWIWKSAGFTSARDFHRVRTRHPTDRLWSTGGHRRLADSVRN